MKRFLETPLPKTWLPHLTHSAFCLAPRVKATGFLNLIAVGKNSQSFCPVKQRWALLESNPPRDSWIERRRNKTVSTFGETQTSPKANWETFISEPEHAFQNSSKNNLEELKNFSR
jgi:hypothetical protein